jgi:hypothetical protein
MTDRSLTGLDAGRDVLIELTFKIKFYKTRDVMYPQDEKDHPVGIECIGQYDPPLSLAPIDSRHRVTSKNAKSKIQEWLTNRALLSTALALADAEFAANLPKHVATDAST